MKFIFATLHVKNLEESIQFYENVVGMKLARRFPGGPHTEIAFMADGPAEIELICNTEAEPVVYGECPSLGLSVEDLDQAMEHMETMAALSLSVVLRECKQMGTALTVEQGVRFLESHILPHQNRSILKNRADEIAMQFQSVLAKNNRQGIRTQAEKKEVASAWLELAISCAKVPVKYEADEIKRRQKEEKTQRETEPVMA